MASDALSRRKAELDLATEAFARRGITFDTPPTEFLDGWGRDYQRDTPVEFLRGYPVPVPRGHGVLFKPWRPFPDYATSEIHRFCRESNAFPRPAVHITSATMSCRVQSGERVIEQILCRVQDTSQHLSKHTVTHLGHSRPSKRCRVTLSTSLVARWP